MVDRRHTLDRHEVVPDGIDARQRQPELVSDLVIGQWPCRREECENPLRLAANVRSRTPRSLSASPRPAMMVSASGPRPSAGFRTTTAGETLHARVCWTKVAPPTRLIGPASPSVGGRVRAVLGGCHRRILTRRLTFRFCSGLPLPQKVGDVTTAEQPHTAGGFPRAQMSQCFPSPDCGGGNGTQLGDVNREQSSCGGLAAALGMGCSMPKSARGINQLRLGLFGDGILGCAARGTAAATVRF